MIIVSRILQFHHRTQCKRVQPQHNIHLRPAYPSEPSCVLIEPTSFHQSMNQFCSSNNSWTSFSQYEYIYSKFCILKILVIILFRAVTDHNFFQTCLNVTASRSSGDIHFLKLLCFSMYGLILCRMYQNVSDPILKYSKNFDVCSSSIGNKVWNSPHLTLS